MPYNDPDDTDPMELQGMVVETDNPGVQREMATSFIEEFMRMGYGRDYIMSLFMIPDYIGPYMAYQELGPEVILELIEEQAALWGGRRETGVASRDANGDVQPVRTPLTGEGVLMMNGSSCGHHTPNATPGDVLKQEHRVIEKVLDAMERMIHGGVVDSEFTHKAIDFLRNFADGCHHAKEEEVFFPTLERHGIPRAGGPIGCMLSEHDEGRRLIKSIESNLDGAAAGESGAVRVLRSAVHNYVALLREHIQKEDNVLFVMADHVLDSGEQSKVIAGFDRAEEGDDPEKHERYVALADELLKWNFAAPAAHR